MKKCSVCEKEIVAREERYIRREWKKAGYVFCNDCTITGRAYDKMKQLGYK